MKTKLVYFGTGPVAAKSLELLAKEFEIEAVITKPKPAHHRGDFPVVELAGKLGLKLLYATNKKELSELFQSKIISSKLGVVIDYGIIIGGDVIDYFPLGIVNSHFSLLPEWRGADPITFSLLSGQAKTGVSLMLINEKLDEGEILAQGIYEIPPNATTPVLTDTLIELSQGLLAHYLPLYIDGELESVSQTVAAHLMKLPPEPTYSRKLTKDDGKIDWSKPAEQIEREIRAFIEWPKSYTTLVGKEVIITKAHIDELTADSRQLTVGEPFVQNKVLSIVTGRGLLVIDRLKPAGKKEMSSKEFLAGYGTNSRTQNS